MASSSSLAASLIRGAKAPHCGRICPTPPPPPCSLSCRLIVAGSYRSRSGRPGRRRSSFTGYVHGVSRTRSDPNRQLPSTVRLCSSPRLRLSLCRGTMRRRGGGGALSSVCSVENLRWVSTISAVVLLFVKNTGIQKPFLVPLLALNLPRDAVNWIRSELGMWTAFLALSVRLFYSIPGELELPLVLLLLVITAPFQVMQQRSSQAGLLVWATLALFIGYQQFTKAGGPSRAFDQKQLVPSVASLCLVTAPLLLLFQGH